MFFASHQATNLSSNGSLTREPRENKVRSMATQLLAKFEGTPRYTVRNSQVNNKPQISNFVRWLLFIWLSFCANAASLLLSVISSIWFFSLFCLLPFLLTVFLNFLLRGPPHQL